MRIKNPPVSPNTITSSAVCDVPKQGNNKKRKRKKNKTCLLAIAESLESLLHCDNIVSQSIITL